MNEYQRLFEMFLFSVLFQIPLKNISEFEFRSSNKKICRQSDKIQASLTLENLLVVILMEILNLFQLCFCLQIHYRLIYSSKAQQKQIALGLFSQEYQVLFTCLIFYNAFFMLLLKSAPLHNQFMLSISISIFSLLISALFQTASPAQITLSPFETNNLISFSSFQTQYAKHYDNPSQRAYREQVFLNNKAKISENNSNKFKKYKLALNKFADLTEQQFITKYGGLLDWNKDIGKYISDKSELKQMEDQMCLCDFEKNKQIQDLKTSLVLNDAVKVEGDKAKLKKDNAQLLIQMIRTQTITDFTTLIEQGSSYNSASLLNNLEQNPIDNSSRLLQILNVDWTQNVGPVIEQGSCGSCYAAATVQTVQALYSIYVFDGLHIKFSIQQIIDCSNTVFDGCLGGWLQSSFQFIKDFGITSHFQYPYSSGSSGSSQSCLYETGPFKINSYSSVTNSCTQIRILLNTRPVAAGISGARLQFYHSGTFDNCIDAEVIVDHAIIIVKQNQIQGWKIKNSWGTEWGENGYAWITNDPTKNCGLCRIAASAFLESE